MYTVTLIACRYSFDLIFGHSTLHCQVTSKKPMALLSKRAPSPAGLGMSCTNQLNQLYQIVPTFRTFYSVWQLPYNMDNGNLFTSLYSFVMFRSFSSRFPWDFGCADWVLGCRRCLWWVCECVECTCELFMDPLASLGCMQVTSGHHAAVWKLKACLQMVYIYNIMYIQCISLPLGSIRCGIHGPCPSAFGYSWSWTCGIWLWILWLRSCLFRTAESPPPKASAALKA